VNIKNAILIILSALFLTSIAFVSSSHAASSTNVTLENDLYRDMEFWAAEGLIESQLSSIKPLARSEVGKQILAALDKCDAMENKSATCRNIQEYYAKLFEAEIAEARSPQNISSTFVKPVEAFSVFFNYLNGPFSIYNNEGIHYGEDSNVMIQLQSQARLWQIFSFYVEPVLMYNQHFYKTEDGYNVDMRLHKGYAKITLCNIELQVGRDSLWWGPGYHSSLLMSNNAHPFDMIKLSNPEPVLLPWIFSYLGPAQFNLIFSQLNDVRKGIELANPFLYGLRLDIKPHPYLELGASHLVLFGGPGRRDMSLGEIITTLYSNTNYNINQKTDSNQEFAIDFALTMPNLKKYIFLADGLKFYCEVGAEDSGIPPDKRAYLAGLTIFKPFTLERAALRAEYSILSPYGAPNAWYNHPTYPMYYDGQVFGDHIGSDAEDIFIEWSQNFDQLSYKLSFDRVKSGIQTKNYPQFDFTYSGEIGYQIKPNTKITLRCAYEDINNYGNIQGERQKNYFWGVDLDFHF
jgi:hypothetical protein